eukprot:scaffold1347_cov350-Pavlova_lutheri.AAC.29
MEATLFVDGLLHMLRVDFLFVCKDDSVSPTEVASSSNVDAMFGRAHRRVFEFFTRIAPQVTKFSHFPT